MAIQKPGNPFQFSFFHSDSHAIYRDALQPEYKSLDTCSIDKNKNGLSRQWIHELLKNGTASINLEVNPDALPALYHLYFQNQNIEKFKGQKALAFAYPFYVEKQTSNSPPICSPLFLWQLEISPEPGDSWKIQHHQKLRVFPNDYLFDYLKNKYQIDLTELSISLCKKRQLNSISLSKVCHQLSAGLKIKAPNSLEIEPFPTNIESADFGKSAILKTGRIGIFPSPGSPRRLRDVVKEKPLINLYSPQHFFAFRPDDADQNGLIQTIFNHRITFIEGPTGAGKTYALANVLSNALSNGRKSLIIVDHLESVKKIQKFFETPQLEDYILSLTDPFKEMDLLINTIRKKESYSKDFDSEQYRFVVNKANRVHLKLQKQFTAMQEAIFNNINWQDIVGKFLNSNRSEGKELLNSQLNPFDFDFIIPEYESMKKAVRVSRSLFQRLKTFSHPLRYLNRNIFLNLDKNEALFTAENQIENFRLKARVLHHRYILKQDNYKRKLRSYYEDHYRDLLARLETITEEIDDYTELYGEDFTDSGISLKVYGVFSNRAKNILQARSQINTQYLELREAFEKRDYFDFSFYENVESKNTNRINSQLEEFKAAMQEWRIELNLKIQDEIQRLSNKTVQSSLDYQEQIDELEYSLDLLVEELNTAKIYEQPFQNKMLTIPMRQQYLEGVIDQLDETLNNLRDFDAFYDWNRYWLSLPDIIQKLIRAIVKVKPKDWMAAFESWYYYHLLQKHYKTHLPQDDILLQQFLSIREQLINLMPAHISNLWNERFLRSKKQLKKKDRDVYQLLFHATPELFQRVTMKDFFQTAFENITDRFPVILASPEVAEQILSFETAYFDFVGILQTNQKKISKWTDIPKMGNHVAFFSGSKLLHEDFTQSQLYRKASRIKLNHLHLKQDSKLSLFINAAYYHNELKIQYKSKKGQALHVYTLNGRYQTKSGINKKEADFIVQEVVKLQGQKGQNLGRTGIACGTVEQRNLISYMLLQQKGISIFETIDVLTFDDMNGRKYDLLWVSLVYDKIPFQSTLQEGLNYSSPADKWIPLFSNALDQFVLCHSFTEEQIRDFSEQSKDKALFVLAQFCKYTESCLANDPEEQSVILDNFIENQETILPKLPLFLQEIALALSPYFEQGRILTNGEYKGISLPLAIQSSTAGEPPVAILRDGFLQLPASPAYLWEQQLRKQLNDTGIKSYNVWSVNWWRNPKLEARKLASAVIKLIG